MLILSLLFVPGVVNAQRQIRPVNPTVLPQKIIAREKLKIKIRKLRYGNEKIKLSKTQKAGMIKLYLEMKDKINELENDASLAPEQKKEKIKQLETEYHKKIKNLYTKEG